MEVITIESQAYKNIMSKMDTIYDYVVSQQNTQDEEDSWVDNYEVCTFLKMSDRTLQRLRSEKKSTIPVLEGKLTTKSVKSKEWWTKT